MTITTDLDEFSRQLIISTSPNIYWPAVELGTSAENQSPSPMSPPGRWPELMGIATLAEYLDMSLSTVRSLISKGVIPEPSTAPTPRLKRWKRSVVDERLHRLADDRANGGPSMGDALRSMLTSSRGGQ